MNNRGQVLVLFVLLFPIFIILLILVVDVANIVLCNIKLKSISNIALNYGLDNIDEINSDNIYDIIQKNDNDIDANFDIENNILNLKLSKNVQGIVNRGKIYKVIVCYSGEISDNKKNIRSDNCG